MLFVSPITKIRFHHRLSRSPSSKLVWLCPSSKLEGKLSLPLERRSVRSSNTCCAQNRQNVIFDRRQVAHVHKAWPALSNPRTCLVAWAKVTAPKCDLFLKPNPRDSCLQCTWEPRVNFGYTYFNTFKTEFIHTVSKKCMLKESRTPSWLPTTRLNDSNHAQMLIWTIFKCGYLNLWVGEEQASSPQKPWRHWTATMPRLGQGHWHLALLLLV